MWVLNALCFLLTASCFVLLCFVSRKMAHRIHTASKEHGLAFFRDPDARRISQILIIVMFIMGLGLEGMGVPLGSGVNSFSWWKYLLLLGLIASLVPDLKMDVKTVIGEITTSTRDLTKAIKPEKKNVSTMPETPGQHPNQPGQSPGMTNQHQSWTPEEVVDLGEFIDDGEEVDITNDFRPLMEDDEDVEIVAAGGDNTDHEDMVDLNSVSEKEEARPDQDDQEDAVDLGDFANMEVTEEAGPDQDDQEDTVDLGDFANMEVIEEAKPDQDDQEDAVDLGDFADLKVEETPSMEDLDLQDLVPAESEQTSSTHEETDHEGEDDMREFLKDFS